MALWFSHLRYAEAAAERVRQPLNRLALCWGSLCCDVDKVSSVTREVSHYGREGLNFAPETFLDQAGLAPGPAMEQASFLAGYLSHMAVDEAWYAHLFGTRDAHEALGRDWSHQTTRALNLALDMRNRTLYDPSGLDFTQASGDELLPHLGGTVRALMTQAATAYVGWTGELDWEPADVGLGALMDRFRLLAKAEASRVAVILDVLDLSALDAQVLDFTVDVLERFLDDLSDRQAP